MHFTPPTASVSEYVPDVNPTKSKLLGVVIQPDTELGHRLKVSEFAYCCGQSALPCYPLIKPLRQVRRSEDTEKEPRLDLSHDGRSENSRTS